MKALKFFSFALIALVMAACGGSSYDEKKCEELVKAYDQTGSLTEDQLKEAVDQYCAYCDYMSDQMVSIAKKAANETEYTDEVMNLLDAHSGGLGVGMLLGFNGANLDQKQVDRIQKAAQKVQEAGNEADKIANERFNK